MDPVFSIETIICITTFIVCFFHNIAKDFDTMGFQDLGCLHIYSHYSLKMIKSQHVALTHNICSLIFIHEKMVTKDRNPYSGNALVRVQRVHKPADLWTSPFAPADFEASSIICTRCLGPKFLTHSLVSIYQAGLFTEINKLF